MSSVEEGVAIPNDTARAQQLCILNKQIFASTAIIFAVLINILTLKGYKRILCIEDLDEIDRITTCNKELVKFTILIILIVTFYYLYQSIESFKTDPSCTNRNYLIANILSVFTTIIRFWTIYGFSNNTLSEEESETEII